MNWATNAAARIKKTQDEIATSQRNAGDRRQVVLNNADYLWQELATPLESHTKGFADELPQAKESGLGTLRIGLHTLIISTKAYPVLTLS